MLYGDMLAYQKHLELEHQTMMMEAPPRYASIEEERPRDSYVHA